MAIYSMRVATVGGQKTAARSSASTWCDYVERVPGAEYGNKDDHIDSFVLLPKGAPEEWRNPHVLWAAVDEKENGGRTGREWQLALARELSVEHNREAIEAFAAPLVEEGMCVHVAIHEGKNGNIHAHVTGTDRALSPDGEWLAKRASGYIVRRDGKDRHIAASEWKSIKGDGWEKVFPFKDGEFRTKTECLAAGLSWKTDREGTKPVRVEGRVRDWGSRERLKELRASWAAELNKALERHAPGVEKVDHRSNADRGVEQVPTLHMGYHATKAERDAMEDAAKAGAKYEPVTVVGSLNEEIERHNRLLRNPAYQRGEEYVDLRQEVYDHAHELREATFETAQEVRDVSRPFLAEARQKFIEVAHAIADRWRSTKEALFAERHGAGERADEPARDAAEQQPQSQDRGGDFELSKVPSREVPGSNSSMDQNYNYARMRSLNRIREVCGRALRSHLVRSVHQYAAALRLHGVHLMQRHDGGEFVYHHKSQEFDAQTVGGQYAKASVEVVMHNKSHGVHRPDAGEQQHRAEAARDAEKPSGLRKEPESILAATMRNAERTHGRAGKSFDQTMREIHDRNAQRREQQRSRGKDDRER